MDDAGAFRKLCDRYGNAHLKEIDVRHLSMPMPMQTTLAEFEELPEEQALYVHHKRVPVYLLEELAVGGLEMHINIVDMGLIYDIEVDDEKNIFITMTLSTRFCPMGEAITGGIQRVLEKTFPEYEVHIDVTFDPPWSLGRLTPEGEKMLMAG